MASVRFHLVGEEPSTALEVDIASATNFDSLKTLIAGQFAIVDPSGIAFQSGETQLDSIDDVRATDGPVGITIDGTGVREVPGPTGIPYFGNFFEVYPDHLGNNQRLFTKYGPIFRSRTLGTKVLETNDPKIALIAFSETPFFSKIINGNHPLYPIKDDNAGVFLSDTDNESWRIVHKFMPPAFGPKAVRHYAPLMNETIAGALPVFDQLEEAGEAWNVYQYMTKLGSQAIGKLVLDMNFQHFSDKDAPMHEFVSILAEALALNKKITSRGEWYAKLPFGDPQKLRDLKAYEVRKIQERIEHASSSGKEDLPLQDAALAAANFIDYCVRATDSNGAKLPKEQLPISVIVAAGAGFLTTATLLSWLIYGLCVYPGMQERLIQELVDNDFTEDTVITAELTEKLIFQEHYIKEMQRVHNPSYQPGRTARIDCILPGGYKIHEGDVIIAALHHIHNNPQYWENPGRFDPDRWAQDPIKHKAQYMPFAIGPRMCIGFNFALQEAKVFLPKLVWRYRWQREGESAVEYDPFFQLIRPVNLYVKTERRTEWPSKSESRQS